MRVIASIVVAVSLTFAAAPSRAADPPAPDAAALEAAKRHFAEGQKLFERNELKPAVEEFKEAYRLTRNPLLLYNIAFVYDRLGDDPLALHYYSKFVDEAADNERTHAQLTEASARAAAIRAKLDLDEPPPPATQPTEPAPEAALTDLAHDLIDQAPPGQPIDVTVRVPRSAPWSVTLHYRAPGQDLYQSVKMRPRPGAPAATAASGEELVARIPAAAVRGTALHYHVAARDPDNKLVAFSGKPQTPNIVYLDEKAPPHHYLLPGDAPTGPAPPPVQIVRVPDRPTPPMTYAKWGTSAGAVALIGGGVTFVLLARNHAEVVEGEAIKSQNPEYCQNEAPPCRVYSQQIKDLESRGRSYETWGNVLLLAGGGAAIAAGVLWYLDARPPPVSPIVGPGFSGAVYTVPF
jgi:hypothetical protein